MDGFVHQNFQMGPVGKARQAVAPRLSFQNVFQTFFFRDVGFRQDQVPDVPVFVPNGRNQGIRDRNVSVFCRMPDFA